MRFLWLVTSAKHERIRRGGGGGQGGGARRSIGEPGTTWAFREAKGEGGVRSHLKETVGEETWVALLVGLGLSS